MAFSYKSADDYESLLGLPEVQGFLEAVRAAEGTSRSTNPYTTGFGFTTIDSLEDHPRELHSWGPGNKDKTSAAGAYQALQGTWDEVAQAIGLTDFSPKSQDIFALARADYRGALDDILSGDIKTAVNEARKEWASFPNAGYPNQKTRSMSFVEDAYQRGFNKALNTPANLSRTATGFSVSPNVTAIAPAVSMMGDTLVSGLSNQTGFTAVPTPTQASRDPTTRGYGALANSLSNAEWAGTNLSGTNFGLPAGYSSQVAQREAAPPSSLASTPLGFVERGMMLSDPTGYNSALGAVLGFLDPAVSDTRSAISALSDMASSVGTTPTSTFAAAPVGQTGIQSASRGTNTGSASGLAEPLAAVPVGEVSRSSLGLPESRSLSEIANSSSLAFDPQVSMTGKEPVATRSVATTLSAPSAPAPGPVGTPANMGAAGYGVSVPSTALSAAPVASNESMAKGYADLANSLADAEWAGTNLSGTNFAAPPQYSSMQAQKSVVTAPSATPAPTSVPTTTAPTTTSKTDADFRSGRDKDRAAFDPDPNAKDQGMKVSIAPTVGRVAGGLLGSMVAGPIGGLLGATLGGKIGSGELGLGGLLGSMAENTDSFTVDNPSGGRGLLDVSGGPVTLGSFTATPTRSSGGYKGFDTNTNWSSYTSPLGITTTMVGDNIVGGPGLSPAAGGNAAGFK